jgi:cell division protein FtsB
MDRGMKRARNKVKLRKRQKRAQWRRLGLRYGLGVLSLFVFMNGLFGQNGYLAMRRARADAEKLRQEIHQLNEENQNLSGEVRALKTDPAAVEKVAREDMGLARPGELVFRLPETPQNPQELPSAPPPK